MADSASCTFMIPDIKNPAAMVFIVLLIIIGTFAAITNGFALVVFLLSRMRKNRNNILISLALSDTLVGGFLCPLTAYQLYKAELRRDCTQEVLRDFLTVSFIGTSVINIACIAYDRYCLVTSVHLNYVRNYKFVLVLIASWVFPPSAVGLVWINVYLSYIVVILMMLSGFLVILVFYFLIMRIIVKNEKKILEVTSNSAETSGHSLKTTINSKLHHHLNQRRVRLAKQVAVLVFFYIVCMIPSWFALVLDVIYILIDKVAPVSLQIFLLFSVFSASFNSCFNPIIYTLKYPEFRRCLQELFTKKRMKLTDSRITAVTVSTQI